MYEHMNNIPDYNNVFGWWRVSTDKQMDGDGERRQCEGHITEMAKRLGRPLIKIYGARHGLSARKGAVFQSPEWKELVGVVRKGDVIITEDLDRLDRQKLHPFFNAVEPVLNKGVEIKTYTENITLTIDNYDCDTQVLIQKQISHKGNERRIGLIIDSKNQMTKDLSEGKFRDDVGALPHWLSIDAYNRRYVKDDTKAELVQRIFDMCVRGHSIRSIVSVLNQEGIKAPRGSGTKKEGPNRITKWNVGYVSKLLRYKAVLGYANQFEDNVKLYPAIISQNVYDLVQHKLNVRKRMVGNKEKYEISMFRGLLKCTCGANMNRHIQMSGMAGNRTGRAYVYRCGGSLNAACDCRGIRADNFDAAIKELLTHTSLIEKLLRSDIQVEPLKLDTMKLQLEEIDRKKKRLTTIITDSVNEPPASLVDNLKQLEIDERQLKKDIAQEEAIIRGSQPVISALEDYNTYLKDKWGDANGRLQVRDIIQTMIEKIVLDKKTKTAKVYFKEASEPINITIMKNGWKIEDMVFANAPSKVMSITLPKDSLKKAEDGKWTIEKS